MFERFLSLPEIFSAFPELPPALAGGLQDFFTLALAKYSFLICSQISIGDL